VHQISDAAAYRLFTQKIVDEGVFDFSLVGCMGQSIVSTPVYLLTGSPYHYNITSAILFVRFADLFLHPLCNASVLHCYYWFKSPYCPLS